MKKLFVIAAAVTALALPAYSQLLYKVTQPNNGKVSYVLGTHHFAPVSILDNIKGLDDALNSVEALYGEYDMSTMATQDAAEAMTRAMTAPAGSELPAVLGQARLDSLNSVWSDLTGGALPLENFYSLKPAALSTQIAAILAMRTLKDFNPMQGVDETMQNRARALGKGVGGLETIDTQLDLLYNTPIAAQAEDLMDVVRNIDRESKTVVGLSDAYMNRNMAAIERYVTDPAYVDTEDLDRLIYQRNKVWAAEILNALPEHSALFVVGAGHLPGQFGLLNLLRISGCEVTPVDAN